MWKLFGSGGRSSSGISEDPNASAATPSIDNVPSRGFPSSAIPGSSSGNRSPESGFLGFRSPRASQDARMDRDVSVAARNLGDGVQRIVLAAKAKQGGNDEWKNELLNLLGAGEASADPDTPPCDIDVLLANTSCENFALRCVDNDLPPNLIHCMRLLRVMELQHASESDDDEPIGAKATAKVSRLLCALCVDPRVGDQLRQHLFGLLALSGASYPLSGVHVAQAASQIIIAFAEHCLTRQLVWVIHDRKMVVHMTDDMKELCGMVKSSTAQSVPHALTPEKAEQAGQWAIALETIVKLVAFSCSFQTIDLVKDFEAAGGYEVLQYAIQHATAPHGARIVDLLAVLACCPNEVSESMGEKIATNVRVFEIQETLLLNSNPLLRECRLQTGSTVDLSEKPSLPEMAVMSLNAAIRQRSQSNKPEPVYRFDVASAMLSATLRLISDHPDNYDILEDRQHILSYYILAFPCFDDEDLKNFVLKTLEFVITGVGVTDEVTPVNACVEVFTVLSHRLLKGDDTPRFLSDDLDLMGRSLEKLLQFDQRVAPLMVESGILSTSLNALLDRVDEFADRTFPRGEQHAPPKTTPLDPTMCILCRVLKLLVAHQPANTSQTTSSPTQEATNLHALLRRSIHKLGNEAAHGAAGVFESYMSSFASLFGLERDMKFTLQILRDLASLPTSNDFATIIDREVVIVALIRSVLEARSLSRDAFRACGGFDTILAVFLSFEGASSRPKFPSDVLLQLCQAIMGLVDASIGVKTRTATESQDVTPLWLSADVTVDPSSSQLSSGSPSALNRNFIRQRGYYLDLAVAITGTGLLDTDVARSVLDLCLSHVDPSLTSTEAAADAQTVRNPDALRLVVAIALYMPASEEGGQLATTALDIIIRMCDSDKLGCTLREIASCGLTVSMTEPDEFGSLLFEKDYRLQSRLVELLSRIASFRMSYMDFVSTIRCLAGPLLLPDKSDGRVKLPVISSSIRKRSNLGAGTSDSPNSIQNDKGKDFSDRLDLLCEIAGSGERFPRVLVGGESINTIAVLMHQVKLEERLRTAAEEGRLRFIEIESIDASALKTDGSPPIGSPSAPTQPQAPADKVWTPLQSNGFTYSIWIRHQVELGSGTSGNLYILDISSPNTLSSNASPQGPSFLSVWYDVQNQRFNVLSSASYKGEPTCFPVSPLLPEVWHHILMTYSPSKRTMMSRKSAFSLFVNGRALEAEVKVESVNLPPNSHVIIGAPNPALAASGLVRGMLPVWEVGPSIMLSMALLDLDAMAVFAYGADFPGLLWGDRPQRTSLAATGTVAFSMLADSGESGSIASALKRRDVQKLESAGYSVIVHADEDRDDLSSLGLLCMIPPDCIVFAFQASGTSNILRNEPSRRTRNLHSERLVNLARLNLGNDSVATDAIVFGRSSFITPSSFSDCLQWAGGPLLLMPLVNAAMDPTALARSLQVVREGVSRHTPNLEMMQAGGGYRILAVLLKEKGFADRRCLDECLAFAINGFLPRDDDVSSTTTQSKAFMEVVESDLVLVDVDAMKHLLLNHQVWELNKAGPDIPLRLLSALNVLVSQKSVHKAFNARRLHLVGIVRWALHLMLEGSELYTAGERAARHSQVNPEDGSCQPKLAWYTASPLVSDVLVGADPGNRFLLECKNLLRRVLTFMLTPGDLEALGDAIVYTLAISSLNGGLLRSGSSLSLPDNENVEKHMLPGPAARLYLVRLLEELIVDGVNEIVSSVPPSPKRKELAGDKDSAVPVQQLYHAGGVASPNQPYLSTTVTRGKMANGALHPKHHQAQAFLSAFAGFLTPVWFATVLEGCREEASASAVLRLMVLMLQGSTSFETAFKASGGFAPFVASIPSFSTCAGINLSLMSELLNVPILHLHNFPTLDAEQLCEVFDAECEEIPVGYNDTEDPSTGVFALLAECLGKNIKLMTSVDKEMAHKARETNKAVIELISHRHELSPGFRAFCSTPAFLEPLVQTLCLLYTDRNSTPLRGRRRSTLADVPRNLTPTERFVGGSGASDSGGIGMILLMRMVIFRTMTSSPRAAVVFSNVFRSFPIHATPAQVEIFHLVLVEQCQSVINEVLEHGDSVSLANCVGLCSVLLDQQISAFFTAEAAIESVRLSISILNTLTSVDKDAIKALGNSEHALLTFDCAHLASLICVAALRLSLPQSYGDRGDEDLQAAALAAMEANIDVLLLVQQRDRRAGKRIPTGSVAKPGQSSRLFPVWQSASLQRCLTRYNSYPDLYDSENPQEAVLAPLLVALHRLLLSSRDDVRGLAVSIFVALLQHRQGLLSVLLVAEVNTGGQTEVIDVVNRGGFRALLAAHEASILAERTTGTSGSVKRKYASFFDWFDRNQHQVQLVFDAVHKKGTKLFPGLEHVSVPMDDAIEKEQKLFLMRLTAQTTENSILGVIERGELARRCAERTTDSHARWKRQGFDDLAYGASKWKVLLRQLKGSVSIWEGGPHGDGPLPLTLQQRLSDLKERGGMTRVLRYYGQPMDLIKRWKLDLSEGHERQRRRLLPNYEFHGLYNLEEDAEQVESPTASSEVAAEFFVGPEMEATTELLKDLNLKRAHKADLEEDLEEEADEGLSVDTTISSTVDGASLETPEAREVAPASPPSPSKDVDVAVADETDDSSSYGLITGLLLAGDWPERSYNVRRCTGLEVTQALLLWCHDAIYIIDGFEQSGGAGMDGKITRVEREQSSFHISLLPKDFNSSLSGVSMHDERSTAKSRKKTSGAKLSSSTSNDVLYQHRSQRISFLDLYSVFRRRYQLQQSALEFYDVNRIGTLVAFASHKEREEVLSKVLQARLPNSIFSSSYGTFISYTKFINNLKAKVVSLWVNGKMSNFEFLMHLNSFAGRSFNDLTQYPVFPWVIADYDSEEIDLSDPNVYRDLSKPMGAIGEARAKQFRERYEALASTCFTDDDPPPFHYGTHYSCAAYVLYYLMRLEPFSRLALALQGGRFDVADRLFHDIGRSWKSASAENLQDVRELIPEFFYLPDFLVNTNSFDFGATQRGKTVHDVSLPKWAKGDPRRFVRVSRRALESPYVSKNLHHWVDLIFGYKQRGKEAIDSLNVFVHVTYEGEVDLDSMTDPIQRASTIAQIQNFGQTPSRLERRPFPQRLVVQILKEKLIDFVSVASLTPLTPPFCVVGAPHRVFVKSAFSDTCRLGMAGQSDSSVGDMCLMKGQLIGVGRMCTLIVPHKKYFRVGAVNNGVSVHAAITTGRPREGHKSLSFHDALHRSPVTAARVSLNGDWLVTGSADSTIRVWRYDGSTLSLRASLCGHDGSHIKCIDVSTEFGMIISGCGLGKILLWDLRTLTFVRSLRHQLMHEPVISVSINHSNGNIVTLVGSEMCLWDVNGTLLAHRASGEANRPTCATSTDCPEWMEGGVVAVTGHLSGEVRFWRVDFDSKEFTLAHILQENTHTSSITALRVTSAQEAGDLRSGSLMRVGNERQDTLLVGDASGKMSVCKTAELVSYSPAELAEIAKELETLQLDNRK